MSQPLYVFDLDETLIKEDCSILWAQFLVDQRIATQPGFLEEDRRLMDLYAEGKMNLDDYLNFAMGPLLNIPVEEVRRLAEQCVLEHVLPTHFAQAKALIEQLTRDNIDMVIISASVSFLVEATAKHLGVEHALGVDLVEHHGKFSTEIAGVPSYREGKVTRLQQWMEAQDKPYSEIHFYTDSINDLPMCQYADHAYLVNPCEQLRQYHDQFTVLSWV